MNLTPKTRKYVYSVCAALIPLLITLGILTEDIASQVLLIAAAVLAVGEGTLAAAHTPTESDGRDG